MKKKYQKPRIKQDKIKLNFFLSQNRFLDSFDSLANPKFLADLSPSGDCGCISCTCGGCCFLPGTRVIMADGVSKEIQNIKPGETVLSYNIVNRNLTKTKVAKLLIHSDISDGYFIINETLRVTGNHRMWINGSVWERVENLKIGDTFLNSKKEKIKIVSIQKAVGTNTVYNLHINAAEHDYFAENALAHNPKY